MHDSVGERCHNCRIKAVVENLVAQNYGNRSVCRWLEDILSQAQGALQELEDDLYDECEHCPGHETYSLCRVSK